MSLRSLLGEALSRRRAIAAHSDAYRWVNGAGDGLPGVDVDRYADFAVVAIRDEHMDSAAIDGVLDAVAAFDLRGVYLKLRPKHASVLVDTRRDDVAPARAVRGSDAPAPLRIHEHGVGYWVRLGDGLSTGIFLDQRRGRQLVRAHARDKRVLNLFAYHAAFTVAAIAGGARASTSVDASARALERARENLAGADAEVHRLVRADARRFLERAVRQQERYDIIVVDPPSYATTKLGGKSKTFRVARDLRPLASLALRCLSDGGCLLASTNHRGIVRAKLRRDLMDAAADAGVELGKLAFVPDPEDYPPAPGQPCHLKSLWLEGKRG